MRRVLKYFILAALMNAAAFIVSDMPSIQRSPAFTEEMVEGLKEIEPSPSGWFREMEQIHNPLNFPLHWAIASEDYDIFGGSVGRAVKNAQDAMEIAYYYLASCSGKRMGVSDNITKWGWWYDVVYFSNTGIYDVSFNAIGGYGIGIDAATGDPLYYYLMYDD